MENVESILQQRKQALQNNIAGVADPELSKALAAAEGEQREWGGKSYIKQGGKWIEVTKGKGGGKPQQGKNGEPPSKTDKGPDAEIDLDNHEIAQLTHMKNILASDPAKAYEIFLTLSPEAQKKVPQEVINQMVSHSHDNSGSQVEFDKLGKEIADKQKKPKETKKHPLEGKHYKDMNVDELKQVAQAMGVKVEEKMSLSKMRSAVGDAIIDQKISEALKKHKNGASSK